MTGAEMREAEERRAWFRECVLPLEPVLRSAAMRLCRGDADAAGDLVHDTLARLIACTGWREVGNVPGYVRVVLRNEALQAARRHRIVPIETADSGILDAFADDVPGPERIAAGRDELRALMKRVEELPPQCRRVFTLRKIYGLSHAEIADRLGLSISTVEKHLIKGLRLCSEALGRQPVDGREAKKVAAGREDVAQAR